MCYNVFTKKINLLKYIRDSKMEGVPTKILGKYMLAMRFVLLAAI